ncbi:hypothetical protein LZ554_002531 [Drepanopeziza brunnea f. sp. 'monogermtubi']|nr:hypothetical protein LZ554_002531 [Drepanopeziza brunnea f. sp. 'monogermtubi']
MMLLSQSTKFWSILLASSVFLSQALADSGREIIGFRNVPPSEAARINIGGKPVEAEQEDVGAEFVSKLGKGYYLINEPAGFGAALGEWYCVVEADSEKMKDVSKVWIPKAEIELWSGDETAIKEYIETVGLDARKALRFSVADISGLEAAATIYQMVIPTEMVVEDELDLTAKCWQTEKEIKSYTSDGLDWKDWEISEDPRS